MRTAPRRGRVAGGLVVVIGLMAALLAQPALAQTSDQPPNLVDGVVGAVGSLLGTPAQTDPVQQLLSGINTVRAGAGVAPLTLDPVVSVVAQAWTLVMVAAGEISHNPDLTSQIAGTRVGENVGRGPSLDWIHNGLIDSPAHYKNMVNPAYSTIGLGVLNTGLMVWVVEDFVQPRVGATTPSPTDAPPVTAGPVMPVARSTTAAPPTTATHATPPATTTRAVPAAPSVVPAVPAGPRQPSEWLSTVLDRLSLLDRQSA